MGENKSPINKPAECVSGTRVHKTASGYGGLCRNAKTGLGLRWVKIERGVSVDTDSP